METYTTSAPFYDHIYRHKDYARETRTLLRLIEQHRSKPLATLLDVACGTGGHLVFLTRSFDCVGVDLSDELLKVARNRLPSMELHQGDMVNFDLGQTFDVVTCLFSAISYVRTLDRMRQAVANMARHVAPGGMLIVEPWLRPAEFKPDALHADLLETADLKLSRMTISRLATDNDRLSVMEAHHLILSAGENGASPTAQYFIETHEMGLFTHEEYLDAMRDAGLNPVYDERGLTGRGLYLGLRST